MQRKYPIIYVRGYAARQSSINDAADDPFYGFNEGSTHVRTGLDGKVAFYQFEGPLLGLIRDHGYELKIRGSQEETLRNSSEVPSNTIWIYRFYDPSADTFANRTIPYEVGDAACKLADLVRLIHQKTKSPVYLVAHSMGGLICRAAIQAVLQGEAEELVAKLVTIGTPHGGIDPVVLGVLGPWLLANFGPFGSKIFSPDRMREYLLPDPADNRRNDNGNNSEEWDPRQMVNFDVKRVLSIVGTNANDYEVAAGLARSVMGPKSDGLVAIRNAYVKDSARAYIHRSHSGRWGEVNSEEAYQNIRRFLFGGLKLQLDLSGLNTERLKGRTWQADVRVLIRGESVVIHEQTAAHFCPVDLNAEAEKRASSDAPIPLVSVFLLTEGRDKCRFAVDVKVTSLDEEQGIFRFNDHLEQVGDWQDTLLIDVHFSDGTSNTEPDKPVIRWEWNSELLGRIAERQQFQHPAGDEGVPWLPLPLAGKALLGDDAAFHLTHQPWE